jgi:hypothetical protein
MTDPKNRLTNADVAQLQWLGGWRKQPGWHTPFLFHLIENIPSAMADQPRSTTIGDNPIGNGLDAFRASFSTVYTDRTISHIPNALGQFDPEGITMTNLSDPTLKGFTEGIW